MPGLRVAGQRSAQRWLAAAPGPVPRPLRLLLGMEIGRGPVDGAWWPFSRDLAIEVLDLANQLPPRLGRLSRVIYSPPDWQLNHRRRIPGGGASVSIGSSPRVGAQTVALRSVSPRVSRVLHLLVVPSEWEERAARDAMRAPANPTNTASGSTIIDEFRHRLFAGQVPCRSDTRAFLAAPSDDPLR